MPREVPRAVLVLCVDRDNDVGEVAGLQTPIVGVEALERAAVEFAAKRPEDSDVNAIFAALKLYRELKEQGIANEVEVALVAGHKDEGVKADMRISEELDMILSSRKFDAVVLVSDGPTDELVLPLVQSKIPVLSVQRVVVQQSRGVEESFMLFLRYVRKLFEEEKYKKYALGVPGGLITLYVLLSLFVPGFAWPLLVAALGLALLVKGFSIDEYIAKTYRTSPILLTALVASALIVLLALASGLGGVSSLGGAKGLEVLGYFLLTSLGEQVLVLDLLFAAALLPLVAQAVEAALGNKHVGAREAVATVLLVMLRQVMFEYARLLVGAGSILSLLLWVALAILALAAVVAILPLLGHSRARGGQ
jgi:putative membrane protein